MANETSKCPECNGVGLIVLFTSAKSCKRCGGTGKLDVMEGVTRVTYTLTFKNSDGSISTRPVEVNTCD